MTDKQTYEQDNTSYNLCPSHVFEEGISPLMIEAYRRDRRRAACYLYNGCVLDAKDVQGRGLLRNCFVAADAQEGVGVALR